MFGRKKLLAQIEVLENRLKKLENMHANVMLGNSWERPSGVHRGALWETDDGRVGFYGNRQLTAGEIQFQTRHPHPRQVDYRCITNVPKTAVDTDRISGVTFNELARYVLDGTPIERKTKEEVVYQTSYSPDQTFEFVNTKLGNISVVERTE